MNQDLNNVMINSRPIGEHEPGLSNDNPGRMKRLPAALPLQYVDLSPTSLLAEQNSDRPFVCTLCEKRFRQMCHLQQHTRIHTNDRPYHCSFCDKKFKQKSQLNQHERIHTGEKPYACPVCHKAFPQAGQLYSHKKLHGLNPKSDGSNRKLKKEAKSNRGRKRKNEQSPVIVSPSPVVYLTESLQRTPPSNAFVYGHEHTSADTRTNGEPTWPVIYLVESLQRTPEGFRTEAHINSRSAYPNITNSKRYTTLSVASPAKHRQEHGLVSPCSLRKSPVLLNAKFNGIITEESPRFNASVPEHLKDFERLIPTSDHTFTT